MGSDHQPHYTSLPAGEINEPSEDDWITAEQLGLSEARARRRFYWAEPRTGEGGRLVWSSVEIGLAEGARDD